MRYSYDEMLTRHTTSRVSRRLSDGSLIDSGSYHAGTHISSCKQREWDVHPNRPYLGTLDYQCDRFWSRLGSWQLTETWLPYFADEIRVTTGTVTPVSKDCVFNFRYEPSVSEAVQEAVDEAKNALFDLIPTVSWNAPVFLAEAKKTTDSIFSVATRIDKLSRMLLTGIRNPSKAKKALNDMRKLMSGRGRSRGGAYRPPPAVTSNAAGLWLEWRYSVQTLCLDVSEASKTLADLLLDKTGQDYRVLTTNRVRTFRMSDLTVSDTSWGREIGLGCYLTGWNTHVLTRYFQGTIKAWMKVRKTVGPLAEANQLGLLNVPLIVWELTALSFVADWFLDIGNYLQRLTSSLGYQIADAGYGVTYRFVGHHSCSMGVPFYLADRNLAYSGTPYEATLYSRVGWENPAPVWTPAIRLNTNRILDAASLIRNIPLKGYKVI